MKLTREELRDELWDALIGRQDIDTSMTDLADACLERMDEIGIEAVVSGLLATPEVTALAAAAREGGDVKQAPAESPQSGGSESERNAQNPTPYPIAKEIKNG